MATPAQAAAATVGAGSLAAAGAYGITSAVKSGEEGTDESALNDVVEKNPEPQFKTLSDEASEKYTDKTLGNKAVNKPLLVDYKSAENQKWWEWAYENIFKPEKEKTQSNLDPIFQAVTKNYDPFEASPSTTKTSLNYACHKAYGLKWYEFTSENHLLDNVKLFCTKGLTAADVQEPEENNEITPLFLKEVDSVCDSEDKYKSKFACKNENKNKLVAPIGKGTNKNEDWWKWSYKKHFLDQKAQSSQINTHFSSVTSAFSETAATNPPNNRQTSLNQACDAAYKLASIESSLQENVKLFCSKGVTTTSQLTFS